MKIPRESIDLSHFTLKRKYKKNKASLLETLGSRKILSVLLFLKNASYQRDDSVINWQHWLIKISSKLVQTSSYLVMELV